MKRILKDKMCICGQVFRPKGSLSKFCSIGCHYKNRTLKGKLITCVCGKESYKRRSWLRDNNYCSTACAGKAIFEADKHKELTCENCHNKFSAYVSYINARGRRFCSKKCSGLFKRGKSAKSWKGGKALKKSLWMIFSKYIRQRDNGICISCGKQEHWRKMDAGHYIPKTAGLSIYFDERNVNCQCTYCNRWMHGNLSAYAVALRRKYGQNILEDLDELRRSSVNYTYTDYRRLIDEYQEKILSNGFYLK